MEIVFEGIRNRLSMLPTGLDARLQQISPDGKTLLLTASAARQQNLYTFPLDELATEPPVARQITSTAGAKTGAQFSPDGREVYYLEQGRITIATLETRASRPLAVTAEMDVDFEQEKSEVFAEAWRYLNDNFFDPKFNGADWKRRARALRPARGRRAHAGRTAPRALPDAGRVERLAHGNLSAGGRRGRWSAARNGGQAGTALRCRGVSERRQTARLGSDPAGTGGGRRRHQGGRLPGRGGWRGDRRRTPISTSCWITR